MRLDVQNFRGVKKASIAIDELTLLAGPVGAGKTSLLDGLRSCLTGSATPLITKPSADQKSKLVHNGATGGTLRYGDDRGTIEIDIPSGDVRLRGAGTHASSAIACGLTSIPDMTPKARAETLTKLLRTEPSMEELEAALSEAEVPEAIAKEISSTVLKRGFDAAYEDAKQSGAKAKGAWEQVTGQRYGSTKAASWLPEGWDHSLSTQVESDLRARVEQTKDALDAAIKAGGASEAEKGRLSERAVKLPGAKEEADRLDKECRRLSDLSRKAAKDLAAIPEIPNIGGHPCPHCGEIISGTGPYQAVSPEHDPDRTAQRQAERNRAKEALDRLDADAKTAARAATAAEMEVRSLEADKKRLDDILRSGQDGHSAGDEACARNNHNEACHHLEVWVRWKHATEAHQKVCAFVSACKVLAPDGLRKTKLAETLNRFNGHLDALCEVADIETVEIDGDLAITMGGRPYASLSTGEQYLARIVLQMEASSLDGSSVIVVDIDRPLDRWALEGIINLLHQRAKALVLVAVTLTEPREAPDLSCLAESTGRSVTYWVSDGIATPMGKK